jgi:hypothetical protein
MSTTCHKYLARVDLDDHRMYFNAPCTKLDVGLSIAPVVAKLPKRKGGKMGCENNNR